MKPSKKIKQKNFKTKGQWNKNRGVNILEVHNKTMFGCYSITKLVGRGKIEFPSPEEPDLQSGALPLTRYLPLFWWFLQVTILSLSGY